MKSKTNDRPIFTKEMRKTHTILIPCMLPMHFKILANILTASGYKVEILDNSGKEVTDAGLRYVHNDACYPALLVIGQFITALESGKYDPHRVALMISQTGGGCRASNYIALLRKALERAGYGYIPVVSFSVVGLESNPGFKITLSLLHRMMYSVTYGDLLMCLLNQCRPYEINKGQSQALADKWTQEISDRMMSGRIKYREIKENYAKIVRSFAEIPLRHTTEKVKVGIVGEIFVKFSPLGNNKLEEFLLSEGAEVVMPGLYDFLLYCVYNGILDAELYGMARMKAWLSGFAYRFLIKKQDDVINAVLEEGTFTPPGSFEHTRTLPEGYMGMGAKMGEGWLLTAEMLELIEEGVNNIVCTQPFGCLPNHIVGKGVMKHLREAKPGVNIVAIDYDPGATKINQENRIKLMLANAVMTEERLRCPASPIRENEKVGSAKDSRETFAPMKI
ncbi:MAG: 2-hydroxyacyl-CoA dehydratase [Oscillospiraceae bacterium]